MKHVIYIASRTREGGIYKYVFNREKGYVQTGFTPIDSPMYMILKQKRMHVLSRAPFQDACSGYLYCDVRDDGELSMPSKPVSTEGEIACHLTEFKGKIYCVNYTSGDVTKVGEKTVNHNSEDLPVSHPHYIGATPDGKFLCVTDLGQDFIYIYDADLNCLNKIKMPSGHGVRHLVFSSDGKYVFSANELQSTVSALEYRDGDMKLLDTISCLPCGCSCDSSASAIRLHQGKIYIANRGHDSVSEILFNGKKLQFLDCFSCRGKTPRDFIFDDERIICTNQDSNNVTVFEKENNNKFKFIQQIDIQEPICVVCVKEE